METPLLKDPQVFPDENVLKNIMGDSYKAYTEMIKIITAAEYGLVPQWNYYKDGKAWLCKVGFKKKTVFWLSVWDGYFKTSFYFVERHCPGVLDLDINKSIKEEFKTKKPFGTLFPLAIEIRGKEQVSDLLKVIEYKKRLK
ncbi:MAG: DUF3788 family protein [Bacteroidales bacterium]